MTVAIIAGLLTFTSLILGMLYYKEKDKNEHNKMLYDYNIDTIKQVKEFYRTKCQEHREQNKRHIQTIRKIRDTVYYDPYSNEIIMCNRLMPIGRLEQENEQ